MSNEISTHNFDKDGNFIKRELKEISQNDTVSTHNPKIVPYGKNDNNEPIEKKIKKEEKEEE